MRRSQLRRRTALTRTRFVGKPTSRAKAHRDRMDDLRTVVFARDADRCQVRSSVCQGRARHAHHVLPRGRGGPDTLENLISVCVPCHTFLHDNPVWSYERGVLAAGYGRTV